MRGRRMAGAERSGTMGGIMAGVVSGTVAAIVVVAVVAGSMTVVMPGIVAGIVAGARGFGSRIAVAGLAGISGFAPGVSAAAFVITVVAGM